MQSAQPLADALGENVEKPAQRGRAGDGLNAQHLGHSRVALQPGHAGEFVRATENAAHVTQGHVGGIVGIGTGGRVGQDVAQLLAEAFLVEEVRPDNHPPVDGAAPFVSIRSRTVWSASGRGPENRFGFITASPPDGALLFELNRSG